MYSKLFYYNPTCEMAVANGEVSYMPQARLRKFEEDLETIMMWLGDTNDLILLRNPENGEFIEQMASIGLTLPKYLIAANANQAYSINGLHPWGWSPAVHKFFTLVDIQMPDSWQLNPMRKWRSEHKSLLSRLTGLELLKEAMNMIDSNVHPDIFIPAIPEIADSVDKIREIENNRQLPILLKTPWSASGRGLFKIRDKKEQAWKNQWVLGKLKQQGFLLAEPFLNKLQDVSFHFWSDVSGIKFLGYTFFKADKAGQFTGCFTHSPNNDSVPCSFIETSASQAEAILIDALRKMNIWSIYHGPIGIDGFIFRNSKEELFLHPCIEMNLRYTMGLVNLKLRERMAPEKTGQWKIKYMEAGEWQLLANSNPLNVKDGLITVGVLPLTSPALNGGFMAYLEVF